MLRRTQFSYELLVLRTEFFFTRIFKEMNGSPDFDLGLIQPGNESESSNSVGISTPAQFDLLSSEPEINSFPAFSSHTPVVTQYESTSNSVAIDTSLALANFSGRSQFCGELDSDNSDIQNFVRILGRCTYSGNLESEKEDSWNQIESKKKDFAASQLPEGLALSIQYENKLSNNEGQQEEQSKMQSDKNYSGRKIPNLRRVVKEVMKLRSMQNAVEPVLVPLIRRLVKEELEIGIKKVIDQHDTKKNVPRATMPLSCNATGKC